MSDTIPFAPLTREELNRRTGAALEVIGWRVSAVFRNSDGHFTDLDLAFLREKSAEADAYLAAALARTEAAVS